MPSGETLNAQLRYLDGGGQWVTTTLGKADGTEIVRG